MSMLPPVNTSIQAPKVYSSGTLLAAAAANPQAFGALTPNELKKAVGGDVHHIHELQQGLANRVRPDMSPQELGLVGMVDKGLALVAEIKKIEQEVYDARLEGWEENKRRRNEQRQRLSDAGVIFGL